MNAIRYMAIALFIVAFANIAIKYGLSLSVYLLMLFIANNIEQSLHKRT